MLPTFLTCSVGNDSPPALSTCLFVDVYTRATPKIILGGLDNGRLSIVGLSIVGLSTIVQG